MNNSEFEQNKFLSEIESLKNKNKETEEHLELKENSKKNSRGAGRKPRFTEEEKNMIRNQRKEGKTIKELAVLNNCSFGIIHKILHE